MVQHVPHCMHMPNQKMNYLRITRSLSSSNDSCLDTNDCMYSSGVLYVFKEDAGPVAWVEEEEEEAAATAAV
jgi:hypothetical protein